MKILWTRSAISDLRDIRNHIDFEDPQAANRIGLKILESVGQIESYPNSGRTGRVKGTRELIVVGTNYYIPYRIRNEEIQLLRVLHGRQEYP